MTGLTRLRSFGPAALLAVCVALALPAEGLAAAATPKYTKESQQAYESQLQKGEIAEATVNKFVRSLRLTLKNGDHVLYSYPAKGGPKLEEELKAKGIPVTTLHGNGHKHKKSAKHTRRYVAIGVVVIVVLAGVAFLMFRRRPSARD
jgi:hypothetical protein